MTSLRSYKGQELDSRLLPAQDFLALVRLQRDNPKIFVRFYSDGVELSSLTFIEFTEYVFGAALELQRELGLTSNSKLAVVMENSLEALVCYSAAMALGIPLIPLDPKQRLEYYHEAAHRLKCDHVVTTVDHVALRAFPKSFVYRLNFKATDLVPLGRKRAAVLFNSSGTTGRSKGISQSFESLLINSIATVKAHSITSATTHFCVLPLFHVNAFSFSFVTSLLAGNTLILNKGFHFPRFWETVSGTKSEIVSAIPPILRLLAEDLRQPEIPIALRYIVTAATHLSKKTLTQFEQKFGVRVIQAYGLSEAINFTATFPTDLNPSQYGAIHSLDERTTIGVAVWGNEIFVLDPQGNSIHEDLVEGEIAVRGWNIMNEYFESPDETKFALRNGYFHTGDLGYFRTIEGRRFYYISGRLKEVAKVNGANYHLNQIDEAIARIELISDVCSVCYFDQNNEEQIGLYIVPKDSFDLAKFKTELRGVLPQGLFVRKIVVGESVLCTPSGKKKRSEMAQKHFYFGNEEEI